MALPPLFALTARSGRRLNEAAALDAKSCRGHATITAPWLRRARDAPG
jgi:hypothetical protein